MTGNNISDLKIEFYDTYRFSGLVQIIDKLVHIESKIKTE